MKPAEMLQKTQKRLSKEIEMRERTIETLEVLSNLYPDIDILHAVPSQGPLHSTMLELGGTTFDGVEEIQKSLTPIQLLLLKRDGLTTFAPSRLHQYTARFADHIPLRIMPCLFQITGISGDGAVADMITPEVIAEWWIDVSDFTVKVRVRVQDHGFVILKKKPRWIFEPPLDLEGYDHVQWYGDESKYPGERTYFRLDAHGWDG